MDSLESKRAFIIQKRQELKKRYGPNPVLYGSGRGINSEKEYPEKMRINLNRKIIEECLTNPK